MREIQIKTTQRFHFSSIRLTKVQKDHRTFSWQNYKEQALSYVSSENANQHSPSGREFGKL